MRRNDSSRKKTLQTMLRKRHHYPGLQSCIFSDLLVFLFYGIKVIMVGAPVMKGQAYSHPSKG